MKKAAMKGAATRLRRTKELQNLAVNPEPVRRVRTPLICAAKHHLTPAVAQGYGGQAALSPDLSIGGEGEDISSSLPGRNLTVVAAPEPPNLIWASGRMFRQCLMVWLAFAGVGYVRSAEVPVKLTGIVRIEDQSAALLEIETVEPGRVTLLEPILRAGERAATVELVNIHQEDGGVELAVSGVKETLHLYTNQAPAKGTLNLRQAKLEQVLEVYQQLAYQTVIRTPQLVSFRVDLQSEPNLSAVKAVQLLEKVFNENGLFVEHRGKFALIVPSWQTNALMAIPNPPEMAANQQGASALTTFPPGLIKFIDTDVQQALDFYAELSGKNLLRSVSLPPVKVTVRSQTSMDRAEAVWLLETILRLGGIATIPAGGDFTFVVPADQGKNLPKYDEKVWAAKARSNGGLAQIKFEGVPVSNLLGFYAELTGRTALPIPADMPTTWVYFRAQKPLTPPECLFVLEALAELNHVRFQLVGDKEVRLEAPKRTGNAGK